MSILYNCFFVFFSLLPFSFILGNGPWNINFVILSLLSIILTAINFRDLKSIFDKSRYFLIFFGFFCIYIVINSFYSEYWSESLTRSIPFLKYLFIFIGIIIFKKNFIYKNNLIFFFNSILILSILIVLISSFAEFFNLNLPIYSKASTNYRLVGPFGDEEIVGIYLFSFLPVTIFIFEKYNLDNLIKIPSIFFISTMILLSGERMAILMTLALLFFYFLFRYKKIVILFTTLISIMTLLIIIFIENFSEFQNKNGYVFRINQTISEIKDPFETSYFYHYKTAFEIFKNHKIAGAGVKSFRYECKKNIYNNINANADVRCRTHPHNLHLEIISETGSIGYVLFIISILMFLRINKKIVITDKEVVLLIALLIAIFPLRVSGSIFSSIYGGLFWYQFLIYLMLTKKD